MKNRFPHRRRPIALLLVTLLLLGCLSGCARSPVAWQPD